MYFLAAAVVVASCILYAVRYLFFPLPETCNIPTIPFWVGMLPLFKDVDQQDVFRSHIDKPLRTNGAVKIFFASRWNVLIHRPEYLAEVFRQTDLYEKSGNQKKIPHTLLANFLGDNIISSHGENWKKYQKIIKPGLQARPNVEKLRENAIVLGEMLLNGAVGGNAVMVPANIQRYTTCNFAEIFFGTGYETLYSRDTPLHRLQLMLRKELFKPLFMTFPLLDRVAFLGRRHAQQVATDFTDHLVSGLENRSDSKVEAQPMLARDLLEAKCTGEFTEKQFRDNVTVLFVAGQENPQLALVSVMYLLAKHPKVQEELFGELAAYREDEMTENIMQTMTQLTAIIYETLRLFPPIGQLINRRVANSVHLGGDILIKEGTYVGYNCYSTNRDPVAWGPDPDVFRPSRWGTSAESVRKEYRRRKARAEFISFHGGKRACLGEQYAVLQIRVTLCTLVRRMRWKLDPTWKEKMTPAGPLWPKNLRLIFEERSSYSTDNS
ncbi:hypothetical protein MY8738_002558 [Beauveria namnaoensis]